MTFIIMQITKITDLENHLIVCHGHSIYFDRDGLFAVIVYEIFLFLAAFHEHNYAHAQELCMLYKISNHS